ncbi:MAG: hybrid sensor histidine kinase/response regulator, partial [Lachnospiraceae bacterium]|nr:hybrid sensor histidine kinase/response regulator [Lachnospiraceae bacterium]
MAVSRSIKKYAAFFLCLILVLSCGITASAISGNEVQDVQEGATNFSRYGGGYAATGQISGVSYTAEVYDASNGLPTSDSMFILAANDGSVFIGGYSGVMRYDGSSFERLDTSDGLTSARGFYQDSKGRIWVATNDNGAVVLDGKKRVHLTYKDGLPSSSLRIFAEDKNENVFIGTATGLCYADKDLKIHEV